MKRHAAGDHSGFLRHELTILDDGVPAATLFRPGTRPLRNSSPSSTSWCLEREKSERLLVSILPSHIAERLKLQPGTIADGFADVR